MQCLGSDLNDQVAPPNFGKFFAYVVCLLDGRLNVLERKTVHLVEVFNLSFEKALLILGDFPHFARKHANYFVLDLHLDRRQTDLAFVGQ